MATITRAQLTKVAKVLNATDITTKSSEYITKLKREQHLEVIKRSFGTNGTNGVLLRAKNGKYYIISARNSNLFIVA